MSKVIIICGPTASFKTAFAHKLALNIKGEIINADSMQIYKQIPIITASPSLSYKTEIIYHLYNFIDITEKLFFDQYIKLFTLTINNIIGRNKIPIIVGGCGLYINYLIYGYNYIPKINKSIVKLSKDLQQKLGQNKFFKELSILDPDICKIINANDSYRSLRAYEVIKQTGISLRKYYDLPLIKPLKQFDIKVISFFPERQFLYSMCNLRFKTMVNSGAIEETKQFLSLPYNFSSAKALGIQEIISYLKGSINIEQVITLSTRKTRQYAKRQITWFSNKVKEKEIVKFNSLSDYNKISQKWITNLSSLVNSK